MHSEGPRTRSSPRGRSSGGSAAGKSTQCCGFYTYHEAHIAVSRVANLIKLPPHQSALVGNGNIKGWKFKALENHLITLASTEDWVTFNKTLALIVFGTILFPFHADTVDHASMDTFFAWDAHSKSPIPAILANTLLSMDFCHQKQGKTLRTKGLFHNRPYATHSLWILTEIPPDSSRVIKGKTYGEFISFLSFLRPFFTQPCEDFRNTIATGKSSLRGQDALISDLVRYCIGLGLLQGIDTVREARDRMPVFALTKEKLEKWKDKDKLGSYSTISLQHCNVTDIINEFHEEIDSFTVRIFHLDNKDPHMRIPEGIFTGMKELRVLTLTDIHLSPLPSSIKCLTIERLPNQLIQLAKLQIFDITNFFELKEIPPDVLSSLTSLEGFSPYPREPLALVAGKGYLIILEGVWRFHWELKGRIEEGRRLGESLADSLGFSHHSIMSGGLQTATSRW
ncbi:hypothetical protein Fmac_001592 [Flemingia macrophylla]|uniref:DUF7745 domain-containing protein n=1 Tax=Flemingia macrophylla TaxID=520843 RepID=A0ABD1NHI6_9FABA